MERSEQRRLAEALILTSPEPIPAGRIADVIPRAKPAQVRELVQELNAEYEEQGRAFEICEVAGGYQIRTLAAFAPYLQQIQRTRPLRLSSAALETLAIVAYRQPVTRAEIEHVRGVDAGAVLRSLLERHLLRIAGHREVPGRPMLYGTTRRFLEVLGLARLDDLPSLREVEALAAVPGGESEAADAETDASNEGSSEAVAADTDSEGELLVVDAAASPEAVQVAFQDAEPSGKPH